MQALCTFSHTAPRFTENEWSQERRELNGSEREAIDADVFGTGGLLFETEAMREKGLVDFEAAMSCITAFNKTTYLKAMHICPDLVESETPAIMFLRCEEFDAKVRLLDVRRVHYATANVGIESCLISSAYPCIVSKDGCRSNGQILGLSLFDVWRARLSPHGSNGAGGVDRG